MGIEDFRKCISLCTDGAPSMIGCHNGLIAKVREFKPDIIAVHSIIHQENLNDKFDNMDHVNSVVVTTLNVKLQGQNKFVHDLFKHLRTFEEDLQLYEQKVYPFPTLKYVFYDKNEILDIYAQRVAVLREDVSSRFTEFRNLSSETTVFSLPCTSQISSAAVQLQLELNALLEDDILIQNFKDMNLFDVYKSLPAADYCNLKRLARRFVCMFGSTYTCE
ncbi:general transcription factor II-I repeat domain-containing protein 2B-like [Lepeophtheirus salmonis]|uniref:general transcription factor II-I repeat domain-containing protein 2B-like n=1 Tax=Lepeophtheirus salmonis TaxID=72036 RepID=UPI001AE4BB50|nr:general transcription factor II-I repeat domain-containing protein 2B-like [Lepeophtheirus salmonis]